MQNIQNLTIDINKKPFQTITANKGEVGSRFIRITIVDNSTPVDLTGVTVSLYAKKPDGKKVFNSVTVEDKANGVVLAELTSQILSVSGLVRLTLLLVKNGSKLASKQFLVNVDESIVDDEAIESTNEFTALTQALNDINYMMESGQFKGEKGDKGDPGSASVAIDDNKTNVSQTWSSSKISSESNLANSGIVKGVFLTKYSIKGSIITLPTSNTRMKIVKADGTFSNDYGNWDKQEYDLSTGGGYLVYDTSDKTTKQVSLPTKQQIVLCACENGEIKGGYLYDSFINKDSPIVNIFNYNQNVKYNVSYTKTIPSTITFPSNYKFKILHQNGKGGTYYIRESGQNEFTVNDNEKLICEQGIFKVVPLTYSSENAIDFLIITQGYINGGYLYELEKERLLEAEPVYATYSGDRINITYNLDNSITLSNPLAKITYANRVYINTKTERLEFMFNEDVTIPKGQAWVYNTLEKVTKFLSHPGNDNNGYFAKLDGLTAHDVVLAHNANGKLVNGLFVPYVEKAKEDIYDIRIPGKFLKYHTKGSAQGIYIIGDELWLCNHSNDEHTDFANISVINKNTFEGIRTVSHNLGHLNTLSYNADNDCLITTNSSKSYSLPPKIWIFPNWKTQSASNKLDFNTLDKIELDFSWVYTENGESKANPCWGENIANKNNIIYVLTNDNKIIRKVVLGKGSNNFGLGTFIEGKSATEYNGTYKIVDTWRQFDGLGVNADVVFHKGKLYTAGRFSNQHSGCYVYQLQTGGNIKKSILQIHNYTDAGVLQANDGQGVEIDGDNLYFFTDSWGAVIDLNSIE